MEKTKSALANEGLMPERKRLVFGVSGASGMPLALALLACYSQLAYLELHLIVSAEARTVLAVENPAAPECIERFAHAAYEIGDFTAPPASGSWLHDGMIICPCSMSSLAAIATGCGANLLHRAADVTLKERRPLALVTRETPLSRIHLLNMLKATEAGACVMPFSPAFYARDPSLEGAFQQFAGRLLDLLRIPHNLCFRWGEASDACPS